MTIKIYDKVVQGSDEWLQLRCGILTASEMKLVLTPTLKIADNDKTRSHLYELAAQRINTYIEPKYISDDMLRGHEDECYARMHYENHFAKVTEVGFITNDKLGFIIGCSPDGLVGEDGGLEIKSRRQKYQLQTILSKGMPDDTNLNCMIQIQTCLLVSERKWWDFISYCGGMPMTPYRVYPDEKIQAAIVEASTKFNDRLEQIVAEYKDIISDKTKRFIETERVIHEEIAI